MLWEVHPGLGLGQLRFGASREEVKSQLGEPEQVVEDTMGGDRVIAWHYWSQGISAHFAEPDGYRLGTLQIDNAQLTLQGERYIGTDKEEMLAIIEVQDWGTVEVDDDPGWTTIIAWELGVTFIVPEEEGVVSSMQLSPLLDEDDNVLWPAA